jgi:hypothetical protein
VVGHIQTKGTELIGAGGVFKVAVTAHLETVISIFKYFNGGV